MSPVPGNGFQAGDVALEQRPVSASLKCEVPEEFHASTNGASVERVNQVMDVEGSPAKNEHTWEEPPSSPVNVVRDGEVPVEILQHFKRQCVVIATEYFCAGDIGEVQLALKELVQQSREHTPRLLPHFVKRLVGHHGVMTASTKMLIECFL